jgi:hypothetical protein
MRGRRAFGKIIRFSRAAPRPHHQASQTMIEINPILAQIADLKGRVESLRGYL